MAKAKKKKKRSGKRGKRKLHGAALAAHKRRIAEGRRGGGDPRPRKRKGGKRRGRKGGTTRAIAKRTAKREGGLETRVSRLERFAVKQIHFNRSVAHNINHIYNAAAMAPPARMHQIKSLGARR